MYNLIAQGIPLILAVVVIPKLTRTLGTDGFGVFSLIWIFIGYTSLFDFGLGRGLTKLISDNLANDNAEKISELIWSTVLILMVISSLLSIIVLIGSDGLCRRYLKLPTSLLDESITSFRLLSVIIPITTVTMAFRGVLEGFQRFDVSNYIRLPLNILFLLAPLVTCYYTNSLISITISLGAIRLVGLIAYVVGSGYIYQDFTKLIYFNYSSMRELFKLGGWMTISNVVGPLMDYLDRFIIGLFLPIKYVAYYATPQEVVSKITIISGAFSGALFPLFAFTYQKDRKTLRRIFNKNVYALSAIVFPICIIAIVLSYKILDIWLGSDFAINSHIVFKILCVGIFFNCMATIPYALIQAIGKPHIVAKCHIIEFLIYIVLMTVFTYSFGIKGAAIAWFARVFLDCSLLYYLCNKYVLRHDS